MKKVSIVIPFLNERENLPVLYERTVKALETQPEALEFLFVDDGSTDGSAEWVKEQAKADPRVRLLRLSRNFGHQIAITAGLDHVEGDAAVILDADLQDPPEVIPDLLAQWREGCEVVYAVRRSREGEPRLKKVLASAFYRVFRAMVKMEVPLDAGDFRLVDRKVVLALREVRELHRFMRGLTCWVGYRQGAVSYDRAMRRRGETKYPLWKSWKLAMDGLTSFSGTLLRWVTTLGMLTALAGFVWLVFTIARKFLFPAQFVWGWTSLVALILVLSGVQIVCIGLVGQYVSRIFEESKKRPLYFLRD